MNFLNTGGSKIITILVLVTAIYFIYCLITVLLGGVKKFKSRFLSELFSPKLVRVFRPVGDVVVNTVTKIANNGKSMLTKTSVDNNSGSELFRKKTRREVELEKELAKEQNRNDEHIKKDLEKMRKKYGRNINSSESFYD